MVFSMNSNTQQSDWQRQDDSPNTTDEGQLYCYNYSAQFMSLSLLPSVIIILLLSFVERRQNIRDCERRMPCLTGRFGCVVPLDFMGKMKNRWSYGFAFGAVMPYVINLIINSTLNPNVPSYIKVLVALITALIILCLGFLVCRFGSFIMQNRLRNLKKQDEVKENEYKHVQCLLRRPSEVSMQKNWFQRKVYEWDPYFKFPNRIIATVVLSIYGLFVIIISEQMFSWWLTIQVYKFWKFFQMYLPESVFITHLNYITYTWYISAACAMLSSVLHVSQVLFNYRKHIKSLRVGEKQFLPKKYKLNPSQGVMGLLKYPSYQIAYCMWGYLIIHMPMFVTGLVLVYLVVSPIREHGFLHWLNLTATSLLNFFLLLALMGLQRMLGHLFFLQDKTTEKDKDKPLALNNRKAFHMFNYFFFFFNMISGIMSCMLRILKSAAVGLMLVSRIERTIMPEGFENMDLCFSMWVGMIMADHYHTNPVLVCFCHLLLKHMVSLRYRSNSFTNSESQVKDRVYIRWHLAYTLLRNPKLILLRKKHKQVNDRERELAFAWAISNKA
ncbi:stimulated by retinoic acid gene 6 protein-like isoform X2 [Silurus meridionalis]|uniref:stimulated by retinoic acid gene 6 protein-like isoform X2 n=1 Tax=Silurus meridionalis TaxID=175797 RepID=UPI001EEC7C54|nr:stimulated by retinoic acid gene 6 protein-like isoform X2 [Silurus meridionalis]